MTIVSWQSWEKLSNHLFYFSIHTCLPVKCTVRCCFQVQTHIHRAAQWVWSSQGTHRQNLPQTDNKTQPVTLYSTFYFKLRLWCRSKRRRKREQVTVWASKAAPDSHLYLPECENNNMEVARRVPAAGGSRETTHCVTELNCLQWARSGGRLPSVNGWLRALVVTWAAAAAASTPGS